MGTPLLSLYYLGQVAFSLSRLLCQRRTRRVAHLTHVATIGSYDADGEPDVQGGVSVQGRVQAQKRG